jgi:glycosyltransferase involved in cell wall biosynthesis
VDRRAFRARLGLAEATPLLLFVGRLDVFHKGLDQLVSALATAPGWHAALVGSDVRGGQQTIMRSAQERGIGSRLTCVGPLHGERLEETFAAADLFVLPSRWEGLPMSLLEALSHGLPALVTPPVEQALGVAAAGAGWVAAPHEIGAVLRALATLDERHWAERRRAARVLAAQFQWPAVARQYATAYAACIGTPPAR